MCLWLPRCNKLFIFSTSLFLLLHLLSSFFYNLVSAAVNKSNFRDLEVTLCVCELREPEIKSTSLMHVVRCPSLHNSPYLGAVIATLVVSSLQFRTKHIRSYMKQWWCDYCCGTWTWTAVCCWVAGIKPHRRGHSKCTDNLYKTYISPLDRITLSSVSDSPLREQSLSSTFNTSWESRFPLPINITHYTSLFLF